MKKLYLVLFSISLFFRCILFADDISITQAVDRNSVPLGTNITLQVTVGGNISNVPSPELPALPDFTVYSAGNSSNISFVNGAISSSIAFNFVLAPKKAGRFQIPPARVTYNGKVYSAGALEIEVTQGSAPQPAPKTSQPAQQSAAESGDETGKSVYVTGQVDKKEAYVNEPVKYSFKLFSAVRLYSQPQYQPPNFSGFFTEDLGPAKNYQTVIGNVRYNVTELSVMLFPQSPGEYTIGSAALSTTVRESRKQGNPFGFPDDFFDDFFSSGRQIQLKTKPVTIRVKPLPAGKPSSFAGAVGKFTLAQQIDKKELPAFEPLTVTYIISGTGNIKLLGDMKPADIPGVRKYDTISSADISKNNGVVSGKKTYKTVLIPEVSGILKIPGITFSYFDADEKAYKTLSGGDITVKVTPSKTVSASSLPPGQVFDSKGVVQVGRDIRFIKLDYSPSARNNIYNVIFILSLTLSALSLAGSMLFAKYVQFTTKNILSILSFRALALFSRTITGLEPALSPGEFYSAVYTALLKYLGKKMKKNIMGLTYNELELALSHNFNGPTVDEIISKLKELDEIRYAPGGLDTLNVESEKQKIKDWVKTIEKKYKKMI